MKPPSSPTSPARAAAILLAAGAIALALGLALLELAFGTWFSSNPWDRALALNIVVDRKMSFDASTLYPGGGTVTYTRDRYGLRGHYGEPRDISILTIGGSTTDERFITDGATWQDELERDLRAAGRNVRVANAGVDGHSTFAHLMAYRYWLPLIPGLKPRYTILYVGLNDLFLAAPRAAFEGSGDGKATLKSRIKANSALFRLYSMVRGTLLARKLGVDHRRIDFDKVEWTSTPRIRDAERFGRGRAAAFGERLAALIARVKASGSTPVCVTQPSLFYRVAADGTVTGTAERVQLPVDEPINGVDFYHLDAAQDEVMKATCAAAGAPLVDMARAPWEFADFYDYVHFSPRGAGKFGRRMAAAMEKLPF